jgi:hypothetical protein
MRVPGTVEIASNDEIDAFAAVPGTLSGTLFATLPR